MTSKPMSDKEYVKAGGLKCPYCGSNGISSDPIEADGPNASARVSCRTCLKEWRDEFRLSGWSD